MTIKTNKKCQYCNRKRVWRYIGKHSGHDDRCDIHTLSAILYKNDSIKQVASMFEHIAIDNNHPLLSEVTIRITAAKIAGILQNKREFVIRIINNKKVEVIS